MGRVYAVQHAVLGTQHALKVLTAGPVDRLVQEGRLQARLDPAHVVPVVDVLDVDGRPALLMPLVRGCSVAELLASTHLTEAEAVAIFADLVDGVAAAHDAGVVHRDLKPSNVLLEVRNGRVAVRITDFGVAKVVERGRTATGLFVGTPGYAAPEQRSDSSTVDHRADLWALGVMFHELLTGRRPDQAGDRVVPAAWKPLINRLLHPEVDKRGASAAELRLQLGPTDPGALAIGGQVAETVRQALVQAEEARAGSAVQARRSTTFPVRSEPMPGFVPAARDTYVGREAELRGLRQRLEGARLVTLLGFGGMGKTRLALQLARAHGTSWPDGIWFCDLADTSNVDEISYAVASALEVPLEQSDPVVQLGHALDARGRCLVILDNFEQVVEHARETVGVWLDRAPGARFLVTSRERLSLPGEQAFELAPLADNDACTLFLHRARAANPHFDVPSDDRPELVALVRQLDCMPLAIELAAARGARPGPVGATPPARRPLPAPGVAGCGAPEPPLDHASGPGLELGTARRRRAGGPRATVGVRRGIHARRGRRRARCGRHLVPSMWFRVWSRRASSESCTRTASRP